MKELNEIVKSVPKEAWSQLAKTTCETFEKLILPLTATTEGVGRLIQNKFNKLSIEQQIIAAKCIQDAEEKTKFINKRPNVIVKPTVIYEALDCADQQTDETIRTLWSNLLAKEFAEGSIHPEIAKLLAKITTQDAILLVKIAEADSISVPAKVLKLLTSKVTLGLMNEKKTFSHVHLENIGLIHNLEDIWLLTTAGREFMKCVSDPNYY
jgi:hypothetical protein